MTITAPQPGTNLRWNALQIRPRSDLAYDLKPFGVIHVRPGVLDCLSAAFRKRCRRFGLILDIVRSVTEPLAFDIRNFLRVGVHRDSDSLSSVLVDDKHGA